MQCMHAMQAMHAIHLMHAMHAMQSEDSWFAVSLVEIFLRVWGLIHIGILYFFVSARYAGKLSILRFEIFITLEKQFCTLSVHILFLPSHMKAKSHKESNQQRTLHMPVRDKMEYQKYIFKLCCGLNKRLMPGILISVLLSNQTNTKI